MKYILNFLAVFTIVSTCAIHTARAESSMLIILDGSNSMWGQIDGTAKIETARSALDDILVDLPPELNVGLMAYGHSDKESCTDVEMLSPLEKIDAEKVKASVKDLKPTGKTPIGYALEQGGKALSEKGGETSSIVLVSDGIETCEGDPCAVAEKLAKEGVGTQVHVVGFNVDAEAKKQLECIADKGNGKYFSADNAADLKKALGEVKGEVKKVAFEKAPEPVAEEAFRDDFDGDNLADHWEVINPDPDSFIVEDGKLLIVSSSMEDLSSGKLPNVFKLNKALPDGDWEAEIGFTIEAPSGHERLFLGAYDADDNWIASSFEILADNTAGSKTSVATIKRQGDKETRSEKNIVRWGCNLCSDERKWDKFYDQVIDERHFKIKLRKIGRDYMAAAEYNEPGMEDYKKVSAEGQKSLRSLDNLVIGLRQYYRYAHHRKEITESSAYIDYIKVSKLSAEDVKAIEAEVAAEDTE